MKEFWNKLRTNSILKFLIVGGCSTGIDFVIYMLLSMRISITISKGISMLSSSVFSYIVNKQFTFENKERTNTGRLVRFYLVFLTNLGVNISVNYLLHIATGNKLFAYMLATVFGMTVNYLGQRFLVFHVEQKK